MKFFLLLWALTSINFVGTTQVVINEVTPDPGNYDGQGAEWTELYNATASPVDISKWILTDGEEIISIPAGTIVPAGGYYLIYNSNFFNCNTCNWDASITATLNSSNSLNLASCGCSNQSAGSGYSVTWDNAPISTNQDRIVLFRPDGTIADAVYYGSGERYAPAGSPILESNYAPGGSLTQIGVNTYSGAINFDIPALTNTVWEFVGPNQTGCTTSLGRISDGGSSWFVDNYPSPSLTNTTPDYSITVNGTPITGSSLGGTLVINTCAVTTYDFQVSVNGYNKVYRDNNGDNGDANDNTTVPAFPNLEGGSSKGGSTVNATGGLSITNAGWNYISNTGGVATVGYTSASVASSTLFTLRVKENTQGPFQNDNETGFNGIEIAGSGSASECYIEQKVQINFISPITSASFTCVNGNVTVTTTPASGVGTLLFELINGGIVLESNNTGKFFIPTGSPATGIRVTQSGTGCGGTITATGTICTAPPACPDPNGETINGGTGIVTACPGQSVTLAVNSVSSVNLTNNQTIDWYSGTNSTFNPYNNEGAFLGQSTITGAPPAPKNCTNLAAGDIAIIDVQASSNDRFSFVPLVPIASGTVIIFTDNGWLSAGGFRTGEGTITFTVGTTTLNAGTVVTILDGATTSPSVIPASVGSAVRAGSFDIATAGDQLIAYCAGPPIKPLAAVHTNGTSFEADATSANTSALPTGLTIGTSAIAVGDIANTIFPCAGGTVTGTTSSIANIVYSATWTNSTSLQTLPSCTYNVNFTTVNSFNYVVPETFCNQTNYFKGVIKALSSSCSQPTATTIAFQVNVTCPTAAISGQSAVCSGSATTVPVTLTNYGTCTQATVNFSIDGVAQSPQGPLAINGGIVNLTGITTAGTVTLTDVSLSSGCAAGICTVKFSGEHVVTIRSNPATPSVAAANACVGDVVQLSATGADVINWYSDASATSLLGSGVPFYFTAVAPAGSVTLYIKSVDPDNGCQSAVVPVTVNVWDPPMISVSNVNCPTGVVQLATGGTNLEFKLLSKNGAGGDPISTTNTTGTFNLPGSSTATFSLTSTVTGCKDIIDVNFVSICGFTLPLKFINFNITKQSGGILLNWKVGEEESVKNYKIEYSLNGTDFYVAGLVNSLRGVVSQYQYFDNRSLSANKIFYRIAAVKDNGLIIYSTLQAVKFIDSFDVSIAPNPVVDKLIVSSAGHGKQQVIIRNTAGQIIFNQVISVNVFEVNTSRWASGIYYLEVLDMNRNEQKMFKIIKK